MAASSDVQQRNVELTRRGFDAYNAGDYEAVAALLDPDVELHDDELVNGGDLRGHAWIRYATRERALDAIDRWRAERQANDAT